MRLLRIWPVVLNLFILGCSLQQQADRAERVWLNASLLDAALHEVKLDKSGALPNEVDLEQENSKWFLTATGASTHLLGKLQSSELRELSGLAPVLGERNKYWAINDSGNKPELFAINRSGTHLASIDLSVRNRDWEDLSSYSYNGENFIALAETGDNLKIHSVSSIYIFRQPDFNNLPSQLKPVRRIDFSYEDGSKNVESMAVSVAEGRIYLIAKDRSEPGVYALPLAVVHDENRDPKGKLTAAKVGQLAELHAHQDDVWWERRLAGRILYEATAADISADDRTAVVANYRHVYLFKRHGEESWASALARKPQILSSHRMQQSEAVAFSANSDEVIVSSEGVNAPLLAVKPSFNSATGSVLQ